MIVVDAPPDQHDAELVFWQAASGTQLNQLERHPEYHGAALPHTDIAMLVQRLGTGPARYHVDIHTDDLDAEVARLVALGAHLVERVDFWCVLRDPAGLLLCVVLDHRVNASNAQRWD